MRKFVNCPICGKTKFNRVFNKKWNNCSFSRCLGCNLIFQNPQEDISDTKLRYGNDYFLYEVQNQHNFFNLVEKTLIDFNIFNLIPQKSKILEIGSATGLFLKFMQDRGYDATGIEVCKESVEYGVKNFNVNMLNCSLEEAGFSENSFDFIHFSHLIEHLNYPEFFLENVYKILKTGGYAMITTPNSKGLFTGFYGEDWRCIVDDHLFLFDKNNLKKILLNSKFEIADMKTWGSIPSGFKIKVLKQFFDKFVKKFNLGDVVCYLVKKK
ncbi:MAG TPA: class I SAM-dependent methyltransferase [Spirochaetota bacterium]|nr:class I SAM-dependent methyltransferase [Spirochaetota bacterium]